jgi:hypothetical protein
MQFSGPELPRHLTIHLAAVSWWRRRAQPLAARAVFSYKRGDIHRKYFFPLGTTIVKIACVGSCSERGILCYCNMSISAERRVTSRCRGECHRSTYSSGYSPHSRMDVTLWFPYPWLLSVLTYPPGHYLCPGPLGKLAACKQRRS